ncbi:kelch repeat-containing protein [Micromonospora sp. NPDC002717]|uniref:Kelch repeat-containing protein n=1 Tax=Micromonospora sp. NPDC002717 TaxID=3154424 RepID=UPI00331906DE
MKPLMRAGTALALVALLSTASSAYAASPDIVVSPGELTVTHPMGEASQATFTVTNSSATARRVTVSEANGTFTIQGAAEVQGAAAVPAKVVPKEGGWHRLADTKATAQAGAVVEAAAAPWVDVAAYPIPIMDNLMAVHEGKVYSVAGVTRSAMTAAGYAYDPATQAWTAIAPLSRPREKPTGAFVGGKLYVVGGWADTGGTAMDVEVFDPATGAWSKAAPNPEPLAASAAAVVDDKLYVVGGCDDRYCGRTTVQSYDPKTDAWTAKAAYPQEISWLSCGAIAGKIYCAGGLSDGAGVTANLHVYNPATDSWSALAPMPTALWGSGYAAAGGQLLVSGGSTAEGLTNVGFRFDPQTSSWTPLPNSSQLLRRGGSACGFYRVGGSTGDFTGVTAAEVLPGYDACGDDVPWLSADPAQFDLPPGQTRTVTVTMDSAGVAQPGTFTAAFRIGTDAGDLVDPVKVTMIVEAPARFGKLSGVVTRASCAGGTPLEGATVVVTSGDVTEVLKTGPDGGYALWLDKHQSPVTVIASSDGWRADAVDVKIKKGKGATASFRLNPYPACR